MPDLSTLLDDLAGPAPDADLGGIRRRVAVRRRRRRLARGVAVLAAVVVIAGGLAFALARHDQQAPTRVVSQPDPDVRRPTVTVPAIHPRRAAPTGGVPVLNGAGTVVGVVPKAEWDAGKPEPGEPGYHVIDKRGDLVGYFIEGPVGFTDVATARDPERLAHLTDCYKTYVRNQSTPGDCADLLRTQGVEPRTH